MDGGKYLRTLFQKGLALLLAIWEFMIFNLYCLLYLFDNGYNTFNRRLFFFVI